MMSRFLCHMLLLLVFLPGRAVVLVKASDNEISCGYDVNCQAIGKLMSTVNEIYDKVSEIASVSDKLVKDVELLTVNMNRSLASTATISAELSSHDGRLKAHDVLLSDIYQVVKSFYWDDLRPQDCTDIRTMGFNISGIYRVYIRQIATDVYCDFRIPTESWLVFQRRRDGSQNFDRNWSEYAHGFGVLDGEFWIGNEKLSLLTMNKKYKLRFELEDFTGEKRWAEYSTFSVKPSSDKYRLNVGGYIGNAGDSLTLHNKMMFSTKDADNDGDGGNCAQSYPGGWWFNSCHHSNLNGLYLGGSHTQYAKGICWLHWKGYYYSLKAAEMKITAVK